MWVEGTKWTDLTQKADRWQILVNADMHFRFLYNMGNSWQAEKMLASQEEFSPQGVFSFSVSQLVI
jgi:hypothetical protein